MTKTECITFRLDAGLDLRLKQHQADSGVPVAEFIRRAAVAALNHEANEKQKAESK